MKWDWQYQIATAVVFLGAAIGVGHKVEKMRNPQAEAAEQSPAMKLSSEELRSKTLFLVGQIRGLAERHALADQQVSAEHSAFVGGQHTEAERNAEFRRFATASMNAARDELREYERLYKGEASYYGKELRRRLPDHKPTLDGISYDHPTNPIGVTAIADDLDAMARALPAS